MNDAEHLALLLAGLRPLIRQAVAEEIAERQAPAPPAVTLLTVADVAQRCGVKNDTVLQWIARGSVKASRLPGTKAWRIRADDLEAALAGDAHTPPQPHCNEPANLADARARRLVEAAKKGLR